MPYDQLPSACSPVDRIESDSPDEKPSPGVGLCLSGGGYRAMLFHVGTIWRLNEAGLLPKLDRISSVSGGSITAGVLALGWPHLSFDGKGTASNLVDIFVNPLRAFARQSIDVPSVIWGALLPGTVGDRIAKAYRKHLFGEATLQALPDRPRFVINATNVQSKALCRFSKPYMRDYRVGRISNPKIELAKAIGASSAFPPCLSPVTLEFKDSDFDPHTGTELQRPPFTTKMRLTDGGVYDNLGLETVWKRYETVLVSDAGGQYGPEDEPKEDWVRHLLRVLDLVDNQVRSLRKRLLIQSLVAKQRSGAYWGIWTNIANYQLPTAMNCPREKTEKIAQIATRLAAMSDNDQQRLINWGYAVCDAAIRQHYDKGIALPAGFPYPQTGVG